MKFDILDLHPALLKGVEDAGFERCTPIQEQSLPDCLAGKDLIAQSQTGTGKTAVFLLTIYNRLMAHGKGPLEKPRGLVMVPTRELAVQVESDAKKLGKHIDLRSVAIYGGVQYDRQIGALSEGVDLIVATPGRMIDLYKSKSLSLDNMEIFVIDEADRMFDMGFAPDICYIADRLPKKKPRQTMLFSATIDRNVKRLSSRYMLPDPAVIEIEPEQITVNTIDQKVIYTSNEEKLQILMGILSRPGTERAIIFTNMKRTAEMAGWKLQQNGYPAEVLTGDVTQAKRQKIIDGMKAGTVKILVATDVAARGLHIEGVTHVINYDLPEDSASYVHRIGRTARAGKSGIAYSLVCEDHALNLPDIEKYIEHKIECEWLEDSEIPEDKSGPYRRRPRPSQADGRPAARGRGEERGRGGQRSSGGRGDRGRGQGSRGGGSGGGAGGGRGRQGSGAAKASSGGGTGLASPSSGTTKKTGTAAGQPSSTSASSGGAQTHPGSTEKKGPRVSRPRRRSRSRGKSDRPSGDAVKATGTEKGAGGGDGQKKGQHPGAEKNKRTGPSRPRAERSDRSSTDVKVRPVSYASKPSESKPKAPGSGGGIIKRVLKAFMKKS
jgi:ATP-dependent RNA helicase RhlB